MPPGARPCPSDDSRIRTSPPTFAAPNFPPVVAECLRKSVSGEELQKLLSGNKPSEGVEGILRRCFGEHAPQPQVQPMPPPPPQGAPGEFLPGLVPPTEPAQPEQSSIIGLLLLPLIKFVGSLLK